MTTTMTDLDGLTTRPMSDEMAQAYEENGVRTPKAWFALNFYPGEAADWQDAGFTPESAAGWADNPRLRIWTARDAIDHMIAQLDGDRLRHLMIALADEAAG